MFAAKVFVLRSAYSGFAAASSFRRFASNSAAAAAASLHLRNGPVIKGHSFGAPVSISGEVVFTTSLVGYPESMTDPSYRGQILVFTQPLIGNYGVPDAERDVHGVLKHFESERIHVAGIVVGDYSGSDQDADSSKRFSHWRAVESLGAWCKREGIPAIAGVDTRSLTKMLRQKGSMQGILAAAAANATNATTSSSAAADNNVPALPEYQDPNLRNLISEVSVQKPTMIRNKLFKNDKNMSKAVDGRPLLVAVVDCGVKNNIVRSLLARGADVELLPWDFDFSAPSYQYDGLLVSNGPGDPRTCGKVVEHLRRSMMLRPDRPIFGICMGNLLMGMAAGFGVRKLQYGNRGHNQPAINHLDGRCYITSQNHGYAVVDDECPAGWMRLFSNANDGSNEGLCHTSLPFSSVQFHPEARGGPRDTDYLFDTFMTDVINYRQARNTNIHEQNPSFLPHQQQQHQQALVGASPSVNQPALVVPVPTL